MSSSQYISPGNGYGVSNLNDTAPTLSGTTGPDNYTNVSQADIYADPAMLAFLQSAGAQQGMDQLAVRNQQAKLAQQIQSSTPEYQQQLAQGLKQIGNNAEANGMYSSGQRLQDQNQYQVGQSEQRNDYLQGLSDQSSDYDYQLATQIATLRQQAAQQGETAAYNVANTSAQAGL